MADVRSGGWKFRQLRQAKRLTQRDIEAATKGQLISQQVSRIEKGELDKPAMEDLVLLGQFFDMTPNEVAEAFDYWHPAGAANDQRLVRFAAEADKLPPKYREKVYDYLALALTLIQHERATEEAMASTPSTDGNGQH